MKCFLIQKRNNSTIKMVFEKLDGNERGDFGNFGMDFSDLFSMFFSQGSFFGGQKEAGGAGKQGRSSQDFTFRFG